jgi:ribonuclease P protein component
MPVPAKNNKPAAPGPSALPADEEGFPRRLRVRRSEEFQLIFAQRRSAGDHNLVVYARPNGTDSTRIGLAVGKKLGNAVVRNRWKRMLREAFRLSRAEIPAGYDLVLLPRRGVQPRLADLQRSLVKLVARLDRSARQRGAPS